MNDFECIGELSVSDSITVLKRGTEPIIRFRSGFVLKLGLVLHLSIIGLGIGSRFTDLSMDPDVNELGLIY